MQLPPDRVVRDPLGKKPAIACDLAVLGAGPGGAAAALVAARAGLNVTLYEPQQGNLDKPCGEGLLAEGVRALQELEIVGLASLARPFHAIRYEIAGADPLRLCLPESGLALLRPTLMALLSAEVAAETRIQRIVGKAEAREQPNGYDILCGSEVVSASTLIVADGLHGKAAPWLRGAGSRATRAKVRYGVRARFRNASQLSDVEVHLGPRSELYLTPLPQGLLNVALLCDLECGQKLASATLLQRAFAEHPHAYTRLGAAVGPAEARRLAGRRPARTSNGTSFLVGDAGGGIDPILGCGLSVALRSGIRAAHSVEAYLRGESRKYIARQYQHFFAREVGRRRWLAAILQSAARYPKLARTLAGTLRVRPQLAQPFLRIAAGSYSLPA